MITEAYLLSNGYEKSYTPGKAPTPVFMKNFDSLSIYIHANGELGLQGFNESFVHIGKFTTTEELEIFEKIVNK